MAGPSSPERLADRPIHSWQGTHLFVRVFQKDRGVVAVPVTAADSYALGALCLRQLRKTAPWLSDQGVMTLLKLTVQRMVPPTA